MMAGRCAGALVRRWTSSKSFSTRLGLSDDDWSTIRSLINAGISEKQAIEEVYTAKQSALLPQGRSLASLALGGKHKEGEVLMKNYKAMLAKKYNIHSTLWNFPKTYIDPDKYEPLWYHRDEERADFVRDYIASNTSNSRERWAQY
eukprot:Sspe_Gene.78917::Locus_49421_Transcript_1_1_Confidence_1.000_Length_532::g.78917::m.78917